MMAATSLHICTYVVRKFDLASSRKIAKYKHLFKRGVEITYIAKAAASQKLSYIQAKVFEIGKTRKQYSLLWFCIWRRLKFVKLTAARGRHCSHGGYRWGHRSGIFHFLFFSQSSYHFSAQMGGRGWRVISGTCSPPFWPGLMLRMGLLLLLLLRLMLWLGQVLLQLVLLVLLLNGGCKM